VRTTDERAALLSLERKIGDVLVEWLVANNGHPASTAVTRPVVDCLNRLSRLTLAYDEGERAYDEEERDYDDDDDDDDEWGPIPV
jgi:hypothetical protein